MRKEIQYKVDTEGRDLGKTYLITEFSADKGEKLAAKIFFAIMNTGIQLPPGIMKAGMEAFAAAGIELIMASISRLRYEVAAPILDEMMEGVQFIPDPSRPQLTRKLLVDDIEEISTRIFVRREVLSINTDFLPAVLGLNSDGLNQEGNETGQSIETSPIS